MSPEFRAFDEAVDAPQEIIRRDMILETELVRTGSPASRGARPSWPDLHRECPRRESRSAAIARVLQQNPPKADDRLPMTGSRSHSSRGSYAQLTAISSSTACAGSVPESRRTRAEVNDTVRCSSLPACNIRRASTKFGSNIELASHGSQSTSG